MNKKKDLKTKPISPKWHIKKSFILNDLNEEIFSIRYVSKWKIKWQLINCEKLDISIHTHRLTDKFFDKIRSNKKYGERFYNTEHLDHNVFKIKLNSQGKIKFVLLEYY
jgi:hypothetical protein